MLLVAHRRQESMLGAVEGKIWEAYPCPRMHFTFTLPGITGNYATFGFLSTLLRLQIMVKRISNLKVITSGTTLHTYGFPQLLNSTVPLLRSQVYRTHAAEQPNTTTNTAAVVIYYCQ